MNLKEVAAQINKQHGKGTLIRSGEKTDLGFMPTGFWSVDQALGGGVVHGGVIEIFGPESSGKTTFTLDLIASFQAVKKAVVFVDAEHSFSPDWAKRNGVDIEDLMFCQPDCGEQALQIVDSLVRSQAVGLVVVDSVSALVPKVELEGEMGQSHVGLQARMMSQASRKLYGITHKNSVTVAFINQIRDKVGVTWGSSETTSGGRGLKYSSFQRIDIRRIGGIKIGEEIVGQRTRIKIVKNKLAAPFKQCELDLRYDVGFCRASDVLDHALASKVVQKKGAWFSMGSEKLGQGREAVRSRLIQEPELMREVKDALESKGKE